MKIDWQNVKQCVAEGLTDAQIAERYSCTVHYVSQVRRSIGLRPNKAARKRKEKSQ